MNEAKRIAASMRRAFGTVERSARGCAVCKGLDEVVRPFARGTDLQRGALQWIAFSLGGEAGARLTRELGLRVGPDTLLNRTSGNFSADARKKPSASSSADGSSLRSSWEDAGRSLPVSRLR